MRAQKRAADMQTRAYDTCCFLLVDRVVSFVPFL